MPEYCRWQKGTDYVVDYTFGKVTILNESVLNSGQNIQVQYEQSDAFSFQTRSLLGTRMDYKLNDDVTFGSTLLYYNERPMVSRNQVGTEPAQEFTVRCRLQHQQEEPYVDQAG